jgi:two-component system, LytTR family, sensor histidine kinase AgrC
MKFGVYEWVYLLTAIFGTYILYRFMAVFFDTKRTSARFELLSYIAYFIVINCIYLIFNIPIITMTSSLIVFFLLTLNYEATIKRRILSTVLIYLILFSVETIVVLLSGYFNTQIYSTNNYSSVTGIIFCTILTYFAVLILNNFKNIKKGESVPNSYWFCIFLIPAASLYIILMLLNARGLTAIQVLTGLVLIFLINFVTFHIYDVIVAALSEKMQSMLVLEQNKYYDKQLEMIKTSLQATSTIRHDLKNHMFSIRSLVESGDTKETLKYISEITEDISTRKDRSATGNTVIDSIINFKLQEAEQIGIKTNLDLKIPEKLDIPSFDMTVILGNLLDNAIKAVNRVNENPFINLKIKYDKGRLIIETDNPYAGEIKEEKGKILTTNKDKENHGIGLESIKKVIQKYDGIMNIEHSDNVFSISLLMYVD